MDAVIQWLNVNGAAIAAVALSVLTAFVKSELMALNKTSAANGIAHYFKLANSALAIAQQIDQPEVKKTADEIAAAVAQTDPNANAGEPA